MKVSYLPGLNGIRAIAFFMVFYDHYFNTLAKQYSLPIPHYIDQGPNGVTCFFTLSGFLITTLLLQEKHMTGTINLKNFYIRRILRIWPLYFIIIILGMGYFNIFHLPSEKPAYFLFYIFFLGNLAYTLVKCIWIINPLWSVAVEEQFYAFWPFLIRTKNVLKSISLVLVVFILVRLFAWRFNATSYYFLISTRIDCMGIGGIFAYLNYAKLPVLKLLFYKPLQILLWVVFGYSFFRPFHLISFFDNDFYSIVAGVIILNVSCNTKTVITLENKVLNYLGKISYGLYSYNMPILFIWGYFEPREKVMSIPMLSFLLPLIVFGIHLLVAHLSYFYFEKRFLERRKKYSVIMMPAPV